MSLSMIGKESTSNNENIERNTTKIIDRRLKMIR
eukprot:CAMPEP_0197290430 /NCGR_PEP_ID=MMETSP0890-20130614/7644_1 /TAXON_ID=44058 ORGANISM="Aureoumbra lagunensis, Strain CCMP1510" /NCGR_SAMPLE_ID=MMETSP0890 /ASSEMBLY_ACC=CAM_ASM_000533 /LENGTH=33 /DNA_ID= /DNA_START= /DNA_END= /DNA_ORIENTATION=